MSRINRYMYTIEFLYLYIILFSFSVSKYFNNINLFNFIIRNKYIKYVN